MKERPILFSGEMVRAILDGRKTQTRRVIKPQPDFYYGTFSNHSPGYDNGKKLKCRYGKPGDQLWVREAFRYHMDSELYCCIQYQLDKTVRKPKGLNNLQGMNFEQKCGVCENWKPSIHMPRWASRIQLDITDVRVERVQDISDRDAIDEGIEKLKSARGYYDPTLSKAAVHVGHYCTSAKNAFEILWDSINAKKGYGWDINPWVWVIEFRRIT